MTDEEKWTRKDFRLGLLFFAVGSLVGLFGYTLIVKGWPSLIWVPVWLIGVLLLFLGANAMFQSLRSRQ